MHGHPIKLRNGWRGLLVARRGKPDEHGFSLRGFSIDPTSGLEPDLWRADGRWRADGVAHPLDIISDIQGTATALQANPSASY